MSKSRGTAKLGAVRLLSFPNPNIEQRKSDLSFRYSTGNSQLDLSIQEILHRAGASENKEALHQMMVTIVKLAQDGADSGDLKIINSTLKEMRYAFKVMKPYRRVRKCAVFGSARCQPDTEDYKQACEFASEIADQGFMVITGAGHGMRS